MFGYGGRVGKFGGMRVEVGECVRGGVGESVRKFVGVWG